MKSTPFFLFMAGVIVLMALANFSQHKRNREISQKLAELEGMTSADPGKKISGLDGGVDDVGGGDKNVSSVDSDPAAGDLGAGAATPKKARKSFADLAEEYAKSVEDNPAIQKQMLAQLEAQLGGVLEGLYEHFELEGDELTHFKGLIAEHWRVQSQVPMQLMSAMGDEDKVAKIKEDLKISREATDARISEFLNDEEDFAYYETYREQVPDRMEIDQYRDAFEAGGQKLSGEQEEELVTAMAEERKASGLGDISDPLQWDMNDFNEDSVVEVMGQMSDFHSRVQVRAGSILDQEQISVMSESQNNIRQQQELGMRFGLQMMEAMKPKDK